MDLDLMYEKFQFEKDIDERCKILIEAFDRYEQFLNEDNSTQKEILKKMFNSGDILFYKVLKLLEQNDGERAEFYFYKLLKIMNIPISSIPKHLFLHYYVLARVFYVNKNYFSAAKLFYYNNKLRMEIWEDIDENSLFYRANCFAMLEKFEDAANLYEEILKIKSDFPEVQNNLEIVKNNTNENLTLELYSLWNFCDYQDVPIFINARDRVGTMKKLIDWLLKAGYRNLIILDNNSTYSGLLNYYSKLEKDSRIKIIRLGKNLGFKALWKSGVLEELKISTPYVYTDPDVLPVKNCPKDFVSKLYEILSNNHEVRKVGPAIVYEDITYYDKERMKELEEDLCNRSKIAENLAYANIDTTFALYSNTRSYSLRFSLRTLGEMRIKHLPWYFDYDNLPKDEKYYVKHADTNSASLVKDLNKKRTETIA